MAFRRAEVEVDPQIENLVDTVFEDVSGNVVVVTLDDGGNLSSQKWYRLPEQRDALLRYASFRTDEDVYVSVAAFSDQARTTADQAATARAVYADADTCDPTNFRLAPSVVVQTSPGRWHCWWVLDEVVPARSASDTAHRICQAHKAQGCDNGWALNKLLRLPGTVNTKYDPPVDVTATFTGEVYTLDQINEAYADVDLTPGVTLTQDVPDPVTPERLLELENVVEEYRLTNLYTQVPPDGTSWSQRLYRLELELFRAGMTPQEVFSVARESACNKYNPEYAGMRTQTGVKIPKRHNPDQVLWRDVQKAQGEYQANDSVLVEDELIRRRTGANKRPDFLTEDERTRRAENPTFVDDYVAWVKTRTDAAETYQRSLGFLLLSCVFGHRGFVPYEFGNQKLNLWLIMGGDTTRTRKSTSKSLFLRVLKTFEIASADDIIAGSDVTREGLVPVLAARPSKSSLFHTDEVSGFFREMFTKAYQTGLLEFFTELYDGTLQKVRRATKGAGNDKEVDVSFNFLGVGIREHIAQVLTQEDFASGFLARMLWSVADPGPRQHGEDNLRLAPVDRKKYVSDPEVEQIALDLVKRMRKWNKGDEPHRIDFTPEAQLRRNQWAETARNLVDGTNYLDAAFERLKNSADKAMCLLAMYDQSPVVTLDNALAVIEQTEFWFADMVRMAGEVSASENERRLDEIERFIAASDTKGSGVLDSTVRRKFAKWSKQTMDDLLDSLKQQGRIRRRPESRHHWQALS